MSSSPIISIANRLFEPTVPIRLCNEKKSFYDKINWVIQIRLYSCLDKLKTAVQIESWLNFSHFAQMEEEIFVNKSIKDFILHR